MISTEIGLSRLSARFGGHDFIGVPLERPLKAGDFPAPEKIEASESRTMGYAEVALREGLPLRQLLRKLAGARGHFNVAGTPKLVADTVEDWFRDGAADGFNVMAPDMHSQFGSSPRR